MKPLSALSPTRGGRWESTAETPQLFSDYHQRTALERFIHRVFRDSYGADVQHFMPVLLGLRDAQGTLVAALGMRSADREPLFLEQYLSAPIEERLQPLSATKVTRSRVIELGNLAAVHPGSARLLIVALATSLYQAGYEWVVFTITPSLMNSFARLGLTLAPLQEARPEALPEQERQHWGRYYDTRPVVCAGYIPGGVGHIQTLLATQAAHLNALTANLHAASAYILRQTVPRQS